MPIAKRLTATVLTISQNVFQKALENILYYKRNKIVYHSHRKKVMIMLTVGEI